MEKAKEKAIVDSKGPEEHSLVKSKHRILNGGQKKILLGGPKRKNGLSKFNDGFLYSHFYNKLKIYH